jgi:predicted nuclease of predicted toxin-antitoxin system
VPAKFLIDENFKSSIVRGLLQQSELNLIRVQDVGLLGADDTTILEWAAQEGRILLTHDVNTITKYAHERLVAGLTMPGVIEVKQNASIRQVIQDILFLAEFEEDCQGQILYLPL